MNPSIMVPKFLWNLYESGWVRVLCTDSFYLFALFDIPGLEKKNSRAQGPQSSEEELPRLPFHLLIYRERSLIF